jgi:flagellar assembly protein FliH
MLRIGPAEPDPCFWLGDTVSKHLFRNIPPPEGSKPSTLGRFIPAEELGKFAAWKPGSLGPGSAAPPVQPKAPAPPPAPTAADWQARINAARQAGYQEGYRDGLVALEGFKESFAQQATAQVGALLEAFDEQLRTLDKDIAKTLAASAVQLARQVLRSELHVRPELVAQVASEAVGAVMLSARQITVQVHPQDLPLVSEGAAEALAARGARLVSSSQIARGGVLVQSDVGSVDARIAGRWAQAAAALGSDLALDSGDTGDESLNEDYAGDAGRDNAA